MSLPTASQEVAQTRAQPAEKTATTHAHTGGGLGHFIHQNRETIQSPLPWFGLFQVLRSYISIIPHMTFFIGTYHVFNRASDWAGKKIEGIKGAGALADVEKMAELAKERPLLRYGHMALNSPLKPILMIGTGFTAYRATSKIFKKVWNEMFHPDNTEADTTRYVNELPKNIGKAAADVIPAEAQSGLYGAIALGGIRSVYKGVASAPAAGSPDFGMPHSTNPHEPGFLKGSSLKNRWSWDRIKQVFLHPKAKFVEDEAITILAYWAYFEFADRLFKDIQQQRGIWPGHNPNELKQNAPKPYASDEEKKAATTQHRDGEAGDKPVNVMAGPPQKDPYAFWTDDPSIGRLIGKRMLPVVAGIGAYVVTNRMAHMAVGRMLSPAESTGLPYVSKSFWHNFKTVGTAMGTFWSYNTVNDLWDKYYDKFFDGLRGGPKPEPVRAVKHHEAPALPAPTHMAAHPPLHKVSHITHDPHRVAEEALQVKPA